MTGRAKILKAFEPGGAAEIGAVACYDYIFIRDHWFALTDIPWWFAFSGIAAREVAWAEDYFKKSGLEWLAARSCPSRAERARQRFEQRPDGVWRVDPATGEQRRLLPPTPGGTNSVNASSRHGDLDALPATEKDIDALIPLNQPFERKAFLEEGRQDTVAALRGTLDVLLYGHISSPLWSLYGSLGYEGMLVFLAQDRSLAAYAGQRILQNVRQAVRMYAALGVDAIWIEECLLDQISPADFAALNVPILRECVKEIRDGGLKSIYYYCGSPNDRLEAILEAGADALHLEESKKGFAIDIEAIARRVKGRCALFGNLDAIGILQNGSEEALRVEIQRQLAAGRLNGGRFIMSTGSPITPETPVARVRRYTDLVRELGQVV
jgi:uroporphyrinogen-III decarboxylase